MVSATLVALATTALFAQAQANCGTGATARAEQTAPGVDQDRRHGANLR